METRIVTRKVADFASRILGRPATKPGNVSHIGVGVSRKKPTALKASAERGRDRGIRHTTLVSGPTENVFASLVVLLGYTHTFTAMCTFVHPLPTVGFAVPGQPPHISFFFRIGGVFG